MIDFDLDEIIDRETRRERALAAGSKHTGPDGPRWQGPRADAVSPNDRPERLYPSQWHDRSRRCWNCGAGSANLVTHPPHGLVKSGETTCMLCGRVTDRWRDDKTRAYAPSKADLAAPKRGRPPKGRTS